MMRLFLVLVFAVLFGYLALQNTTSVPLHAGNWALSAVPVYMVAIGALLLGLTLGWVLNLFSWVSTRSLLHSKDQKLRESEKITSHLEAKIQHLEQEIERYKSEKQRILEDRNYAYRQAQAEKFRSFWSNLRHRLSF